MTAFFRTGNPVLRFPCPSNNCWFAPFPAGQARQTVVPWCHWPQVFRFPGQIPLDLLRQASEFLWRSARVDPEGPLVIDRQAIITALRFWFSEVNSIYRAASSRKIDSWLAADFRHGQNAQTAKDRELEGRVLETYSNSLLEQHSSKCSGSHSV